jgi:hypothetical protein
MTRTTARITEPEIRALVREWFAALDRHGAFEEIKPMFVADGLEMEFPEGPVHGIDGLRTWHGEVVGTFFDQRHEIQDIRVDQTDGDARVHVVVHWRASTWEPPAPTSERLAAEATQDWLVVPGATGPVIQDYRVRSLTPLTEEDR